MKAATIMALCALLAGCGSSQRQSVIKAALITVDVSRDAFVAYDTTVQVTIVDKATSAADGRLKLTEYRTKRERIIVVFSTAYHAIAAAALANDDPSIAGMQAALAQLAIAIRLGGMK